jgi:AAA15 family ATPase/GTPase
MASDSHYTSIRIENFKLFQKLEVSNMGQINLIVGDNNVGKTSLLEALLVNEDAKLTMNRLHKTLCLKNLHLHLSGQRSNDGIIVFKTPSIDYFDFLRNSESRIHFSVRLAGKKIFQVNLSTDTLECLYEKKIILRNHIANVAEFNLQTIMALFTDESGDLLGGEPLYETETDTLHQQVIPFIPANQMYDATNLPNKFNLAFSNSRSKRQNLLKNLRDTVLPNIREIFTLKIHETEHLAVGLEGSDESHPISEFGDGTVKCAGIFMEMVEFANGRLMIDEIGAGIHHSRMDTFWTAIAKAAFSNNVQLFAATHDLEVLQSLKRVFENDKDLKDRQDTVRCIALSRAADGNVKAYTYPWEAFQAAINNDNELR